jgi:hypothetical protein
MYRGRIIKDKPSSLTMEQGTYSMEEQAVADRATN